MDQRLTCLDGPNGCAGVVEYRTLDMLKAWPWCDAHWDERLLQEDKRERSLDTDIPPDWFDATTAGECWDEDY